MVNFKKMTALILSILFSLSILAGCQSENHEETLEFMAKKEGKLVVYSISSRIIEAGKLFEEKYGIKVTAHNLKDGEAFSRVKAEVGNGTYGADVVLVQDSGRVLMELIASGFLTNYIPESMVGKIDEEDTSPLVHQYINKVFIVGSQNYEEGKLTNVWQFTEKEFFQKIYFKHPEKEDVNMNFLTMLTAPDISEKLEKSYENLYGIPLVLSENIPNAGYEFILRLKQNIIFEDSDTEISSIVAKDERENFAGLFVYSKSRYVEESGRELVPLLEMEPFSGFLYPAYLMLTRNAQNPNAAKLFVEFLMMDEGFSPWSRDVGAYSTNNEIQVLKEDYSLDFWKEKLIAEDAVFISQNITEVSKFFQEN